MDSVNRIGKFISNEVEVVIALSSKIGENHFPLHIAVSTTAVATFTVAFTVAIIAIGFTVAIIAIGFTVAIIAISPMAKRIVLGRGRAAIRTR